MFAGADEPRITAFGRGRRWPAASNTIGPPAFCRTIAGSIDLPQDRPRSDGAGFGIWVASMYALRRSDCPRSVAVGMYMSRLIVTMFRFWPRAVCIATVVVLIGCHGLVKVAMTSPPCRLRPARRDTVGFGHHRRSGCSLFLGYIFIPIPVTASSALGFNVDDQRAFVSSLVGELNRLKIVNAYGTADGKPQSPDISVRMTFLRTEERGLWGHLLARRRNADNFQHATRHRTVYDRFLGSASTVRVLHPSVPS